MKRLKFYISVLLCCLFAFTSFAGEPQRLIRDTEVENVIRSFMKPLLYSANLVKSDQELERLEVYVLMDNNVNAFTFGGLTLVITTGLLTRMGPEEAMGIFAHETGHMVSKHVVTRGEDLQNAMRGNLLGMLIGVGAGILNPAAGMAILTGSMEMSKRGFLSYTRSQEASADQSALRLLEKNQFTARGMAKTFKYFEKQSFLPDNSKIEYLLTHPMPENRLKYVEHHIENSAYTNIALPAKYTKPYERIQAKIAAFMNPQQALRKYRGDNGIPGTYAKAIAYMELAKLKEFKQEMKNLDQRVPNDPYFTEVKAQAAFEYGNIPASIVLYDRVHQMLPNATLIDVALAHALIEKNGTRADYQRALQLLKQANRTDPTPFGWHLIAIASGRLGDEGQAAYALAEKAILLRDKKGAAYQIKRAMHKLDKNSPFYRRAMDIKISMEYL